VVGLCLRFGGEQFLVDYYLKKYNDSPSKTILDATKYSGVAIYICGWILAAICLSWKHKGNRILKNSVLSAILVSAIWLVFEFKEESFILHAKLPLISCSILLSSLIALTTLKYDLKDIFMIVLASILIVFSEYFMLPFQRTNNICDGLGLPILLLGWFILFHVFDGEVPLNRELVSLPHHNIPLMNMN
jgi:membrane-bound ClpP family serine protease